VPNAPRIELPRPAIIAAIGLLLLAATFVITKAGDTSSGLSPANTAPASTPSTTTPAPTKTTTTAKPTTPVQPPVTASAGLPRDVARALDAGKVVVLYFYEPAAADDQATRAAVRTARSVNAARVRVFTDVVAHISDYRRIVGALGISQTPAMVVIDRERNARIYEGYLDSGTIRQSVRDVL
jgi:hypothetical protein